MGFGFGIDTSELDNVQRKLNSLPLSLTDEVHQAALKAAEKPLIQRIDVTVPEDTGLLASDLRGAKSKFKRINEYQRIVGFRKRKGGHGGIAHILEYGSVKMAPRPFMRNADERTKSEQDRLYTQQMQKEVDKRIDGL